EEAQARVAHVGTAEPAVDGGLGRDGPLRVLPVAEEKVLILCKRGGADESPEGQIDVLTEGDGLGGGGRCAPKRREQRDRSRPTESDPHARSVSKDRAD